VGAATEHRRVEALEELRGAAERHERLRIEYYAASTAETTTREIDPEEVFFAIGNWYVVAWDHRSEAERLFRADRIRSVRATGTGFEPRGLEGSGRPLYTPAEHDVDVRLRLSREARWVAEYFETSEVREIADGGLEVVLPAGRLEWVERLLLRLGPEAQVIEPEDLKVRVRDLAGRTRKRYG
jgi:proteasome accessory factor C